MSQEVFRRCSKISEETLKKKIDDSKRKRRNHFHVFWIRQLFFFRLIQINLLQLRLIDTTGSLWMRWFWMRWFWRREEIILGKRRFCWKDRARNSRKDEWGENNFGRDRIAIQNMGKEDPLLLDFSHLNKAQKSTTKSSKFLHQFNYEAHPR